ncbi:hypothetical protein VA596_30580 [Amycolatopsis sp., V23-08]|uniref:Uncharacterized protein n=1 Tax=Amycolatopsis heterodermiae TaxID=3110235 RepID=A0ABU5RDU1_9PSEU|nr:hypothetical protein [Amycolatopsis sp., V23-08]MEA5363914.1 hypothetical protein [Amycolatopsis sp., V23-08]
MEPVTGSLIWLGHAAAAAAVGRLAERAVDRVFDGPRRAVTLPEPRRHRIGEVTSDVDVDVRHAPAGRRPVLLAFQTAPAGNAGDPHGVTVPMLLGETAHLTLARDDYLISALVLDPPAQLGGKPVLHGVGWVRHWVASSRTDRLTVTTEVPTTELLERLGLRKPDGTGPFELPPSRPAWRQLPGMGQGVQERCRASVVQRGSRCTMAVSTLGTNGLCLHHDSHRKAGGTVHDWATRKRIR